MVLHYSYKNNAIVYCHFILANKILLLAFWNFSFFLFFQKYFSSLLFKLGYSRRIDSHWLLSRIWRRHAGIRYSFALTKYINQQWVEIYTNSARIRSRKSYSFTTQYLFSTLYVPESIGDMAKIKTGLMLKKKLFLTLTL